jgi:hypothetical protein
MKKKNFQDLCEQELIFKEKERNIADLIKRVCFRYGDIHDMFIP